MYTVVCSTEACNIIPPIVQDEPLSIQFNVDFQNGLVLRTYMRQNRQTPIIDNLNVKIYVASSAWGPPQINTHCSLLVNLGSAPRNLGSYQKGILIYNWDGMKWHASFCYASCIIIVFKPQISVKCRNKILTSGVELAVGWHKM